MKNEDTIFQFVDACMKGVIMENFMVPKKLLAKLLKFEHNVYFCRFHMRISVIYNPA